MSLWRRNLLLAAVAIALAVIPLVVVQGVEWQGADQRSVDMVKEVRSDYEPWFSPIFQPQELEPYLFGLQALLGTGLVSGLVGWLLGRRRAEAGAQGGQELAIAAGIAAVAVVVAVALLFVQTEFGEIQAFIRAVQGVCLGLLGFFAGYPLGRRRAAVARHPA